MFNDYDKVKKILRGSFSDILKLMDEKNLTYEEIKNLLVKTLYKVSKEDSNSKDVSSNNYGKNYEVKTVITPQMLYAPPSMPVKEVIHDDIKVEKIEIQQALYGPPPMFEEKVETVEIIGPEFQQVLYGPPQVEEINLQTDEVNLGYGDGYIPGTAIKKPRAKLLEETEEQYLEYLDRYYSAYFPDNKNKRTRR